MTLRGAFSTLQIGGMVVINLEGDGMLTIPYETWMKDALDAGEQVSVTILPRSMGEMPEPAMVGYRR